MSDLSEYEEKQEKEAVISIDELLKKNESSNNHPNKMEQINLESREEAFLKKINNIKSNLIRR